jgi:hypothetical protein
MIVLVMAATVEDNLKGKIQRAAYDCPTGSISFTEG